VAITEASPSNDGEIYAYGLSSKGSDWVTVHFRDVASGKDLPDVLEHTKWPGIEWNKENTGVFYSVSHWLEVQWNLDVLNPKGNVKNQRFFHYSRSFHTSEVI